MTMRTDTAPASWLSYSTVWRWHFYAGLFCLPFFCWLAVTGSIYLFRPDVEDWLDRPYESLPIVNPRAAPSSEARAAMTAVPGSTFSHYEPPATPTGAAQVVVAHDGHFYRMYVHPQTLKALKVGRDDHRFMDLISHLHGSLLLGNGGSMVVELAGSWGVVMIVTGLYLWWPRGKGRVAGLLYPRLRQRGRLFWRDLHAVTGIWVSVVTLFMLLSGLPWAVSWGNYLTWARNHWSATTGAPDWPIGGSPSTANEQDSMPAMSAAEMAEMSPSVAQAAGAPAAEVNLEALDRIVPTIADLKVPRPIWVSPPATGLRDWTISSHIQNRPRRVTYSVDPDSAVVTATDDFGRKNVVDKVVNVAIATHEGQLFGRINQAILLLTAVGLLLMAGSAAVMWWRRRPAHTLGAPPLRVQTKVSGLLVVAILAFAVMLPLFGLSLVLVLILDRVVLRQLPAARQWLGLTSS